MNTRFSLLPDPAFLELKPALSERLDRITASLTPEQFASLLDPLMRRVLERGFAEAGAHEGTVWLMDGAGECLVPVHNTGPQADRLVGKFKQPLNAGLICMVFASEQPFLENEIARNAGQSKLLDTMLEVQTWAMIAVPFHLMRACRGVVSCVQLKRAGQSASEPPGFQPEHLASVQLTATLLSQLIEHRLLGQAVGWTSE
jgi:GAF domain